MKTTNTEFENCKLALELYRKACDEYSNTTSSKESWEHFSRKVDYEAEYLTRNGEEGLRIGGPMSGHMKFKYGNPALKLPLGTRAFYIFGNDIDENGPAFQKFQAIVAKKFKDANLPFVLMGTT